MTGKLVKTWKNPIKPRSVSGMAISPDEKTIASGGHGGVVLWTVATGEAKIIDLPLYNNNRLISNVRPYGLRFSPKGDRLYAMVFPSRLFSLEMPSGKLLHSATRAEFGGGTLAVGRKGKFLAVGETGSNEAGGFITLRDADTLRQLSSTPIFESSTIQVAFAANDKYLFAKGEDRIQEGYVLRVWDVATGKQVAGYFHKKMGNFAISPDGKHIAMGYGRNAIHIYSVQSLAGAK